MDKKNMNEDKRTNEEIRKEIEQLEKLIEKVREQNKKNRKKSPGGRPILKINLAAVYSRNFYINLLIAFLINFITVFVLVRLLGHLFISKNVNDMVLMGVIFGFSVFEELYKKYLFKYHMQIVIYSVGTIFFLLNMIYFYAVDYALFGFTWFISAYHPIIFVIIFGFVRYVVKQLYKRLDILLSRRNKR